MGKRLETLTNVAIIITAILLGIVVIKNHLLPGSQPTTVASASPTQPTKRRPPVDVQIEPGTKLGLTGIDWAKNGQTVVLALSDKCRFCSESAPFYQRLVNHAQRASLVAVLPQTVEQGKSYLEKLNVAVDDVRQAPLIRMGVTASPTLILVDEKGAVIDLWVGKLSANREAEVLARLKPLAQ